MTQIEKLQIEYTTYKWNYDKCSEFSKDRYYKKMKEAWDNLKKYKLKYCPELLEQPKRTYREYVRIDDQREHFEINDYQ